MNDIILLATGLVVGAMNAIAGGGMLVALPVMIALGIPPIVANATSALVILPGNIASSWVNRFYLRKIPRNYLYLIIPATIGTIIGAALLVRTTAESFERIIPGLIAFAVLLFAFQPLLHQYISRHIHGPKRRREQVTPLYIIALAILPLTIYAGYFGAGFGFIMLAFLSFTAMHDHMHRMNALKNATAAIVCVVALICLHGSGLIDWRHGTVLAVGNLIGGYFAAQWLRRVPSRTIRIIVIVIGVGAAAYLALRI